AECAPKRAAAASRPVSSCSPQCNRRTRTAPPGPARAVGGDSADALTSAADRPGARSGSAGTYSKSAQCPRRVRQLCVRAVPERELGPPWVRFTLAVVAPWIVLPSRRGAGSSYGRCPGFHSPRAERWEPIVSTLSSDLRTLSREAFIYLYPLV